ncbi:hypothetical protein SELMODRAFT_423524 [Selaginella moellendorffii]|uniref:Uncharacterized protein n=1 Tax=Selaginella moellendorffii TaxID=88036 RepID=D8SLZ6_SELML|nr:hypothetical protein SELMODRAFT_423524 [Selaginella moellendorffii]
MAASLVFYCEAGGGLIARRQVPDPVVGASSPLWPLAVDRLDRRRWSRLSGRTGRRDQPFQICGYYAPFSRSFCSWPPPGSILDLEIVEPLYISLSVATYSTVVASTGEYAVLKLDYDPNRSACMKLGLEWDTLSELRDTAGRDGDQPDQGDAPEPVPEATMGDLKLVERPQNYTLVPDACKQAYQRKGQVRCLDSYTMFPNITPEQASACVAGFYQLDHEGREAVPGSQRYVHKHEVLDSTIATGDCRLGFTLRHSSKL